MPLAEQDRTRWDASLIAEGVALLEQVLPRGHLGRYQLQAATWEQTDWRQISLLYAMLERLAPGPAVEHPRAAT